MRMPSWRAPLRCRPAAPLGWQDRALDGQAMISTATAAVKAAFVLAPAPSQYPERGDSDSDHRRNEHRGDAVGEPLDAGLPGLSFCDKPADLRQLGVGSDAIRSTTSGPPALTLAPSPGHRPSLRPGCSRRSAATRRSPTHLLQRCHRWRSSRPAGRRTDRRLRSSSIGTRTSMPSRSGQRRPWRRARGALGARHPIDASHGLRGSGRRG